MYIRLTLCRAELSLGKGVSGNHRRKTLMKIAKTPTPRVFFRCSMNY